MKFPSKDVETNFCKLAYNTFANLVNVGNQPITTPQESARSELVKWQVVLQEFERKMGKGVASPKSRLHATWKKYVDNVSAAQQACDAAADCLDLFPYLAAFATCNPAATTPPVLNFAFTDLAPGELDTTWEILKASSIGSLCDDSHRFALRPLIMRFWDTPNKSSTPSLCIRSHQATNGKPFFTLPLRSIWEMNVLLANPVGGSREADMEALVAMLTTYSTFKYPHKFVECLCTMTKTVRHIRVSPQREVSRV